MSQYSYQISNQHLIPITDLLFVYVFMIGTDMVVKLISQLSNAFMPMKIVCIKWLQFVNGECHNLVSLLKSKFKV